MPCLVCYFRISSHDFCGFLDNVKLQDVDALCIALKKLSNSSFLVYLKDWKHLKVSFHCITKSSRLQSFQTKKPLSTHTNYNIGSNSFITFLVRMERKEKTNTYTQRPLLVLFFALFLFESPSLHWKAFSSAVFCCNTWNLEKNATSLVVVARILALAKLQMSKTL